MKILIGCEESQAVCIEFRKLGFEAYSCDILPCSGGHPEWHLQQDIFEVIEMGWDCMIAFPPCTHLAVSGAAHFKKKIADGRQQEGVDFFLRIANTPIKHIAIENPVGIMSNRYKKPSQVIQPYYFGDEAQKTTCLWLKNLPLLYHNAKPNLFDNEVTHSSKGKFKKLIRANGKIATFSMWEHECACAPISIRATLRSKTFPGIAKNMATQWGEFLKEKYQLTETI